MAAVKLRLIAFVLAALTLVAAPSAFAKCTLQKFTDLPVTMVGLRPVITVKINGAEVKLFIDTGSFANTLNPDVAARIGLRLTDLPPDFVIRGLTGEARMRLATARDFTFLGAELHQAEFLVAEHGMGGADGLVGQQIMGKFDVEYDFAKGVARLFIPKDCPANANLGYWNPGRVGYIPIHSIEAPSTDIVGEASINGVKVHVVFDSGTPRSALTVDAARRAGVRLDGPGVEYAEVSGGAGDRVIDTWIAPFDSFAIGDETVKNARLRLGRFELDDGDMLLGADFFLSHHIYVARSQNRLYFSYNGGPVFDLEQAGAQKLAPQSQTSASPAAGGGESAETFARQAAAAEARHQYDEAIADYGHVIALEPNDAQHFYDRGVALRLDDQASKAMDDFNAALKLQPNDVAALMARGALRLENQDVGGAGADFDAAMKADPGMAEGAAELYADAGLYEAALADFDRWIAGHPRNEDIADALGARCHARLMLGRQLDQALADCSLSLHFQPGDSDVTDDRGLLELRLGKLDPALADFDQVVHARSKDAWALYGRGVAELRKGLKPKGDADIDAAKAIDSDIAATAAKIDIAP